MLQILRDKAQSIVIQGIVVIIALVFIFWGVGTNMMNKQEAAIVVNDEEISFQEFQQAYDQAYSRIAQQFGGTIPKGLAESLNIRQQVITQLTQQALLRQGAIEMGLLISGHEIQKEIETMIQFQENGQFNLDRYKTILASNRLSPTKFEKSMRYDLLSQKSITSLSNFAVSPSEFEIKNLYNLEKETVSVSYVALSPDTFMPNIEVLDTDLETWYQGAGNKYLTDPIVKLTYLPFSFKDIGDKITIEDADIQGYYDQHLPEYQLPEKRAARHILFKASPEDSSEVHDGQKLKAAEILDKYIGESERNIVSRFTKARANKPVVLFFDEVEALAQKRQFGDSHKVNTAVSALLTEMDGFESDNEGVLILGATNVPWSLDSAFRRPGRFDRTIFVPPPDKVARKFILRRQLEDRPVAEDLDITPLIGRTSGFSGADLVGLVDTALDYAIEDSQDADNLVPLSGRHFNEALTEVRPSTGEWLAQARGYVDHANKDGLYDDLADFLKKYSR